VTRFRILFLLLLVSLVWVGCFGGFKSPNETGSERRLFETIWVDPVIIYSDTLITIFRSDRIDSIPIDPTAIGIKKSPSIEISVTEQSCNVSVSFHHQRRGLLYPLFVQYLPTGFYRLTFNSSRYSQDPLIPGDYFLKAVFCNQSSQSDFVLE